MITWKINFFILKNIPVTAKGPIPRDHGLII